MSTNTLPEWVKFVNSIVKKSEEPRASLYDLALKRIKSLEKTKDGIIRFPKVFEKLCSSFQIKKEDAWNVLYTLKDSGQIEIVPFQGVRILPNQN